MKQGCTEQPTFCRPGFEITSGFKQHANLKATQTHRAQIVLNQPRNLQIKHKKAL